MKTSKRGFCELLRRNVLELRSTSSSTLHASGSSFLQFRCNVALNISVATVTVTAPWLPPPQPQLIRFHNHLLIFLMYASVWFPLNDQVTVVHSCQLTILVSSSIIPFIQQIITTFSIASVLPSIQIITWLIRKSNPSTGLEGYRSLRLPDFQTIGTWKW